MALPTNWNNSTLDIATGDLNWSATKLNTAAQDINNACGDIIAALNGLALNWTGDAGSAAEDFNTRWNDAMTKLYGPPDDASKGILNILTAGVAQAAQNYAQCEQGVCDMFTQYATNLTQPSGTLPADSTDQPSGSPAVYHSTAVNETGFPGRMPNQS